MCFKKYYLFVVLAEEYKYMHADKKPTRITVANVIEDSRFAGPQKRILNVAKRNLNSNVFTIVYLPKSSERYFQDCLNSNGIEHRALGITTLNKSKFTLMKFLVRFPFEIFSLVRNFKSDGVQLVHCSGGAWQIKGIIAGRIAGAKTIWHLNDTNMPTLVRRVFKYLASWCADHIVVAGQRVAEYYGDYIAPELPVSVIPAPVDTAVMRPFSDVELQNIKGNKKIIRLVTVGHVNPLKGYHNLLRVFKRLQESDLDFELTMVGALYESQKKYVDSLYSYIEENALKNCYFIGPSQEIREKLGSADMYVCSSRFEASPTSVWEAMSMGLPVVSTNVGDVPIFVKSGVSGYVTPVDDVEGMASSIMELARDKRRANEFGIEARNTAISRLDITVISNKHLELYSSFSL